MSIPKLHFLNVRNGDCHIIQHASGRTSVIDICNGNAARRGSLVYELSEAIRKSSGVRGNFGMADHPTHPLDYLDDLGIDHIHRFVLSHPDMDHMDGLDALFTAKSIGNYWDSGVRRDKPTFDASGRYKEQDWRRYDHIIGGRESGMKVMKVAAGDIFSYANSPDDDNDGLLILSPDRADVSGTVEDCNDGSYVILYVMCGHKILIPGDAHDGTWEFVLTNFPSLVANCSVLIAPHHGRDSEMDFEFLKVVNPALVLMGNANSEHLAYDAYRDFKTLTNNQVGNVILEPSAFGELEVYIENDRFAAAAGIEVPRFNKQGYPRYGTVGLSTAR